MITYGIEHHHLSPSEQKYINLEQGGTPKDIAIFIAAHNPDIQLSQNHRESIYGRAKPKWHQVERTEEKNNFDLCELPRIPYFFRTATWDAAKARRRPSKETHDVHQRMSIGKNIKEMY